MNSEQLVHHSATVLAIVKKHQFIVLVLHVGALMVHWPCLYHHLQLTQLCANPICVF
jgi:hypothetical protein